MLRCRRAPASLTSRLRATIQISACRTASSTALQPLRAHAPAGPRLGTGHPPTTCKIVTPGNASTHTQSTLSANQLQEGARIALEHGEYATADQLLQQFAHICRSDTTQPMTLFHDVLNRHDLDNLSPTTVLTILHAFNSSPFELTRIAVDPLRRLLTNPQCDQQIFDIAFDCVQTHLSTQQVPSGLSALDYEPSQSIPTAFLLVVELVGTAPRNALQLFDILVETGHVPSDALPSEDDMDHVDVRTVILSALAKASLHWTWLVLASRLATDLLDPKAKENPLGVTAAVSVLSGILEGPIQQHPNAYLKAAFAIIHQLHPVSPAPDHLIQLFYDKAFEFRQSNAAEMMYHFAQEKRTDEFSYPPPAPDAIGWLMKHFGTNTRRVHLIHALSKEVIYSNITIPPQYRANFIATVASAGHAGDAKDLWRRFVVEDPDNAHKITGNPVLLVPLVRMLVNKIGRLNKILSRVKYGIKSREYRRQAYELERFMETVLQRYHHAHRPLLQAPHFIITTYAQACFTAGKKHEGFKYMKMLLRRSEIPDLYDVNVVLNGVARDDPRGAVKLLDDMITERNLKPDDTTYGTIMSRALAHGDWELVDTMISKLKAMEVSKFKFKSVMGLVRAIGSRRPGEREEVSKARLRDAILLAKTWMENKQTTSPQLGRDLVLAALNLKDAALAFDVWVFMARPSWKWDDVEHVALRGKIKRGLHRDVEVGLLPPEKADVMLAKLHGQETVNSLAQAR